MWNVLKEKFKKSSTPTEFCRRNVFRKRDHDDYPDDDVPPAIPSIQQHDYDWWSEVLDIDEDWVISDEASPKFLEELKSFGETKVPIIADHRMKPTLKDMMRKQFKTAKVKAVYKANSTNNVDSDSEVEEVETKVDDDYDPYDDDLYDCYDMSDNLHVACDDLDIKVDGQKKK
nr:hypothetical protein [Tanacetum cinerariifolium]